MNYKKISSDEYEKLLQNKKNIFNNTFKNTNKLVEDKKQILKTDPDAIIKKQQKDDYIEKLSDLISQKINNVDELKKISKKIDFKDFTDRINLKKVADKIDLKNDETLQPSYKNDYTHFIKNPNILADKIVEIYGFIHQQIKKIKLNCKTLLIKLIKIKILINNIKNL